MDAEFSRHLNFVFHEEAFLDPFYTLFGVDMQLVNLFLLDNVNHTCCLFDKSSEACYESCIVLRVAHGNTHILPIGIEP